MNDTIEVCQSQGNEIGAERFVSTLAATHNADKHSSNGSNDLMNLPSQYSRGYSQLHKSEAADPTFPERTETILSTSDSDDRHSIIHSTDVTEQSVQERNSELFLPYEGNTNLGLEPNCVPEQDSKPHLTGRKGSHLTVEKNTGNEANPISVTELENDDDDSDKLPSREDNDDSLASAALLIANPFATANYKTTKIKQKYATVVYSVLGCFKASDKVPLPQLHDNIGKGGFGEVFSCTLESYRGKMQLACKIEHKVLLCKKSIFKEVCLLKDDQFFLQILAYLIENCSCGDKECSGSKGYLIMEHIPIGSIRKNKNELRKKLIKAQEELRQTEDDMIAASKRKWAKCQVPYQYLHLRISRYQSALVRLITKAIVSTRWLHKQGMLHLDIKEDNFLIRKKCCDTNLFDCDCEKIDFDVLLADFDYVHIEGAIICDPNHVGTYKYRALSLLFPRVFNMRLKAEPLFDHYSLSVMMVSIICGDSWCHEKLEEWRRDIINYSASIKNDQVFKDIQDIETQVHRLTTEVCENCSKKKVLSALQSKVYSLPSTLFKTLAEISGEKTSLKLILDLHILGESNFGPTIWDIISHVEKTLQHTIEHFFTVNK